MNTLPGPLLTFVGAATYDALALVEHYPGADERVVAQSLEYAGGGPAATAAVAARRLGHNVAFVGAVGDDDEGRRILEGLQTEGIDTTHVQTLPGRRSAASVIVIAKQSSTRAISNRTCPWTPAVVGPAARELLAASAWVHVDHVGWRPTLGPLSAANPTVDPASGPTVDPASGPQLSYDGGHQVAGFTAAGLDLYAPTVEALQIRFGDEPVAELLATAQRESGGDVVATHGSAGSVVLGPRGISTIAPFTVDVVSTLGAGDTFHGALVAAMAEGHPLPEATRRANAVAALACRGLDGRSALPTASGLDSFLTDHSQTPAIEETHHS